MVAVGNVAQINSNHQTDSSKKKILMLFQQFLVTTIIRRFIVDSGTLLVKPSASQRLPANFLRSTERL